VAYDVPTEAMGVIDTGAARTAGDMLRIMGASDRLVSASVVRWSIAWDAGIYLGRGGRFNPTISEVGARYLKESSAYDAAAKRGQDCRHAGLGANSAAGMAHYLFSGIDGELCHQFYDQLLSGANLPERSPVLALIKRIARTRADRITRAEQLVLYIRAWNAFREGKPLDRMLITRVGELTNNNFPQPK
jgi:hypothetical protein